MSASNCNLVDNAESCNALQNESVAAGTSEDQNKHTTNSSANHLLDSPNKPKAADKAEDEVPQVDEISSKEGEHLIDIGSQQATGGATSIEPSSEASTCDGVQPSVWCEDLDLTDRVPLPPELMLARVGSHFEWWTNTLAVSGTGLPDYHPLDLGNTPDMSTLTTYSPAWSLQDYSSSSSTPSSTNS